jgi:ribosomal-protein-alanine N-acetyltransferase
VTCVAGFSAGCDTVHRMPTFSDQPATTPRDEPWPSTITPLIQLVKLDAGVIDALSARDLAGAAGLTSVPLTSSFIADENWPVWQFRSRQLATNPEDASWVTRVVYDPALGIAVGRAGYHAQPDSNGMVEVGYSIDPAYRRRGYARAALSALLDRARLEPAVRVVRASISPDNVASLALVAQFSFVAVGEQWDDEDGLETIFEVST